MGRLHPLKVMKIIIEKDPPRLEKRRSSSEFVALVECCLQKDPKKRPQMNDEFFTKHKKFFAKANQQALVEILRHLPALDARIPPKPNWRAKMGESADRLGSGSWDFRTDEADDDPLDSINETEAV